MNKFGFYKSDLESSRLGVARPKKQMRESMQGGVRLQGS